MLRIWSILSTRIFIRKKTVKAIHHRYRKKNKSMQSWRWITFFSLELFFFPAESFSEKYIQITSKGGDKFWQNPWKRRQWQCNHCNSKEMNSVCSCIGVTSLYTRTDRNARLCTQHCSHLCPGDKGLGHQYLQCWLNIHCIGPVSYRNSTLVGNNIRKLHFEKLKSYSTHCGLVTPYGDRDVGQHWLKQWLVAWRHKAITWTNADW